MIYEVHTARHEVYIKAKSSREALKKHNKEYPNEIVKAIYPTTKTERKELRILGKMY